MENIMSLILALYILSSLKVNYSIELFQIISHTSFLEIIDIKYNNIPSGKYVFNLKIIFCPILYHEIEKTIKYIKEI